MPTTFHGEGFLSPIVTGEGQDRDRLVNVRRRSQTTVPGGKGYGVEDAVMSASDHQDVLLRSRFFIEAVYTVDAKSHFRNEALPMHWQIVMAVEYTTFVQLQGKISACLCGRGVEDEASHFERGIP